MQESGSEAILNHELSVQGLDHLADDTVKIMVTGGAGFIGSCIVDKLVEAGYPTIVVDNLSTGFRRNLNPSAKFHECDVCSEDFSSFVEEERPHTIIHLAAQIDVRISTQNPAADAHINIVGTINVLEACVKAGVSKLIFASTGGAIYGEPDALPATEDTQPRPLSHYGTSKLAAEHYIRLYHVLHGLNFTTLRFPNVYGPRQNPEGEAGVCAILAYQMLSGKTPTLYGYGSPVRDYVYVEDVARAALLALDRADAETINIGSDKGTSVSELFEIYRDLLDFRHDPKLAPLRPGEVDKIYISGKKAEQVLGWKPQTDLRSGLRATLDSLERRGSG